MSGRVRGEGGGGGVVAPSRISRRMGAALYLLQFFGGSYSCGPRRCLMDRAEAERPPAPQRHV